MANIRKANPVGLDKRIDDFQVYLFDTLGYSNWECFPRVYMNESEKGLIPEYYEGTKEYEDVLYNDRVDLSSFFFRSSREEREDTGFSCDVALVFQADLPKLFSSISHRADEEFDDSIRKASENYDLRDEFELVSMEHLINNVYREFNKDKIRQSDMSNRYVVRANYRVHFFSKCP